MNEIINELRETDASTRLGTHSSGFTKDCIIFIDSKGYTMFNIKSGINNGRREVYNFGESNEMESDWFLYFVVVYIENI